MRIRKDILTELTLVIFTLSVSINSLAQPVSSVKSSDSTDYIRLKEGDSFHGKLEYVEKGTLTIDITVLDKTEIDLEDIAELRAESTYFQVDIQKKGRIAGKIYSADKEGFFKIVSALDTIIVPITDIIVLKRISDDFSDHFSEWAALAFSYSGASRISRLNVGNETGYETEKFKLFQSASLILTRDSSKTVTDRIDAVIGGQLEIKKVWMAYQAFEFQSIRSAGLNGRFITLTGFGRRLVHNRTFDFNAITGIDFIKEKAINGDSGRWQVEIPFILTYDLNIISPKFELTGASVFYFNLSVPGRHRVNSNLRINYEFTDNFTVGILSSFAYDNKPLYSLGKKSDFNISLALGYEF